MSKIRKTLSAGIIAENPTFMQVLGMCPVLAVTTSVMNAIGMGIAVIVVLSCSNMLVSACRRFIPDKIRIAAYVIIIAGFVTAVDLLMKAYFRELSGSLGIFIPLIVVNCIILARAEMFASKNNIFYSLLDGISMGTGFTLALLIIGSVREILGNGTFLDKQLFGNGFMPMTMMLMPVGAFLVLGTTIALVQYLRAKFERGGKSK